MSNEPRILAVPDTRSFAVRGTWALIDGQKAPAATHAAEAAYAVVAHGYGSAAAAVNDAARVEAEEVAKEARAAHAEIADERTVADDDKKRIVSMLASGVPLSFQIAATGGLLTQTNRKENVERTVMALGELIKEDAVMVVFHTSTGDATDEPRFVAIPSHPDVYKAKQRLAFYAGV